MGQNEVYTALGFAQRAGKLVSGETACEKAMRRGNVKLFVVDELASEPTKKRWMERCKNMNITFAVVPQAAWAIGQEQKMAIAVIDPGFAQMIQDAQASNTISGI